MRINCFRIAAAAWLGLIATAVCAAPDIQQWQTPNGVRVLFVQDDILPMLDVRLLFDAASSRDDGLPGLAALTNGLLAEGAAGKSAQQIAEDFESVGAKFDNNSLRDMAYVGVRTLTRKRYLDRAMDTLAEVLTRPDFPAQAFERELARMKVAREATKQSPSDIAEEAFYKALYRDHPYATPVGGTDESLAAIRPDDVRAFYRKILRRRQCAAGDGRRSRSHAGTGHRNETDRVAARRAQTGAVAAGSGADRSEDRAHRVSVETEQYLCRPAGHDAQ